VLLLCCCWRGCCERRRRPVSADACGSTVADSAAVGYYCWCCGAADGVAAVSVSSAVAVLAGCWPAAATPVVVAPVGRPSRCLKLEAASKRPVICLLVSLFCTVVTMHRAAAFQQAYRGAAHVGVP
jgi:hypothetical protein